MTIKTFDTPLETILKFSSTCFTTKPQISFDKTYKIFALFLFVLTLSISSSAATFTVNTINDGDDFIRNGNCATLLNVCTLRAAVQEANAQSGDDVIVFAPALANQKIRLSSLIGNDIDIRSNILIDATGVNGITVASDNLLNLTSRIFQISNATVTMNNFRIAEGRLLLGVLGGGGGIFATGSNLTLNNMTVQDNGVLVTGNGGGIYVAAELLI